MIFQQAPGWWIIRTKGWAECSSPSFSMGGRKRKRGSLHHSALVVLCTFFHLGANVKFNALGQSYDGFPLLAAFPCFKGTLGMREEGGRGWSGCLGVWGQKPHVEWEAAKRRLCSSSSGPVVLEGWLLQASSKNCELGNRSVQLGSRCSMKHTKPSARRMWIIDKKKKERERRNSKWKLRRS